MVWQITQDDVRACLAYAAEELRRTPSRSTYLASGGGSCQGQSYLCPTPALGQLEDPRRGTASTACATSGSVAPSAASTLWEYASGNARSQVAAAVTPSR